MLSEHISGENFMTPASRSSTVMVGDPPVVMLTTASVACLMRGRNCMNTAGSPVGRPSGLRVAGVQMQDGGAGLGGADGLLGDLIGGDRQGLRHGGRVDRAGDGASDDDLVGFRSHCFSPDGLADRSLLRVTLCGHP